MRARSARPGVGFPVREIRGEAPSENSNKYVSNRKSRFSHFEVCCSVGA